MSSAVRALRSDVVRRAASRGGTLRCAEAPRVACRDVDKSYASHRPPQHGAVAKLLQDSAAAIRRAPKACIPAGLQPPGRTSQSPAPQDLDRYRPLILRT